MASPVERFLADADASAAWDARFGEGAPTEPASAPAPSAPDDALVSGALAAWDERFGSAPAEAPAPPAAPSRDLSALASLGSPTGSELNALASNADPAAPARIAGELLAPRTTRALTEPAAPPATTTRMLASALDVLAAGPGAAGRGPISDMLTSRYGAIAGAAATDATEWLASLGVGRLAVRAAAPITERGARATRAALGLAFEDPTLTSRAFQGIARDAIRAARRTRVAERAIEGITAGELFSVLQAVDRGETKPLQDFVINPLAVGALGLALLPIERMVSRFTLSEGAVSAARDFLTTNPRAQGTATEAAAFARALGRVSNLSRADAQELAFNAAISTLDPTDTLILRRAIRSDPSLLDSEFGLHVARMQRTAFEPTFAPLDRPRPNRNVAYDPATVPSAEPLRATVELPSGATESRVVESARDLLRSIDDEGLTLLSATGHPEDLAPLRARYGVTEPAAAAPRVEPPNDIEILRRVGFLGTHLPEPGAGLPAPTRGFRGSQLPEVVPPSPSEPLAETLLREDLAETLDPAVLAALRSDLDARFPDLIVGEPPSPAVARAVRASGPTQRALDEAGIRAEAEAAPPALLPPRQRRAREAPAPEAPSPAAAGEPWPPAPPEILEGEGHAAFGERRPPPAPPAPPRPDAAERVSRLRSREPMLVRADGRDWVVTADPTFETALIVSRGSTDEAYRVPISDAEALVSRAERELRPGGAAGREPTPEEHANALASLRRRLAAPPEERARERRAATARILGEITPATTRGTAELARTGQWTDARRAADALLAATGDATAPADAPAVSLWERLRTLAESERGSVRIIPEGQPVRGTPIPDDDPLGVLARAVSGTLVRTPEGRLVFRSPAGAVEFASEAEALAGLRGMLSAARTRARLGERADLAATTGRIPDVSPFDANALFPERILKLYADAPPLGSAPRYLGRGVDYEPSEVLRISSSALTRIGPAGAEAARTILAKNARFDLLNGEGIARLERALENLQRAGVSRDDLAAHYRDLIERGVSSGEPARDRAMRSFHAEITPVLDAHYETATRMGIPVAPRRENYVPQVHDWELLSRTGEAETARLVRVLRSRGRAATDDEALDLLERWFGTPRQRAIDRIVERQRVSPARAAELLDLYISENKNRTSAHLEHERMLDFGGVRDIIRTYKIAIARNARRLAEVESYGLGDARMNALLNRIAAEGGESSRAFAQKLFNIDTGIERFPLSRGAKLLYNYQAAKLSLSVIANAQQTTNTLLKTDLDSTIRALGWTAADLFRSGGKRGKEFAAEIGAITSDLLDDYALRSVDERAIESLRKTRAESIAEDWIARVSLSFFNHVETKNRVIASKAGEYYFNKLVRALSIDPASKRTRAALAELNVRPDDVLRAARANDADSLSAMRAIASLATADASQFKNRAINMPLWRSSSKLGKFSFQFKSFSFNQTKMVLDELRHLNGLNPAYRRADKRDLDPRRGLRALAVLATVYPTLGAGVGLVRRGLFGPSLATDQIVQWMNDPSNPWEALGAYGAGMAISGGLGIISDLAFTALTGNRFALQNYANSPAVSTGLDTISMLFDAGRGLFSASEGDVERARTRFGNAAKTALRQAPFGPAITHAVEEASAPAAGGRTSRSVRATRATRSERATR